VRFDIRALGAAVLVEGVLAALALHGGPHGSLGAWPWTLQLPGILLFLFVPGETHFWWRAAGMLLIQLALWYGIFRLVRRMRPIHHV
jgi:hypothetical protein